MAKVNARGGGSGGSGGGLTEAEVKALIRAARDTDLPFAGLTGLWLLGSAALSGNGDMKLNTALKLLQVRLATADYQRLKPSLARGNALKIRTGDGLNTWLSTTITNFTEFDESAASDTLDISLNDTGALTDNSTGSNLALDLEDADAEQWNAWADGRAEANFDAKVEGEVFEASDGFAFVSSGSDLQAGKVWVESGANADDLKMRGRDADGADTLAGKIHAGTLLLYGDIDSAYALVKIESVGAVTGSGANRVFSFKFASHRAKGIVSGTDYPLRIFPDLPSAIKDIIAPQSLPVWALSPDGGTAGKVVGVKANGDVGFVADRHSIKKSITRAGTTTATQANSTTYIQYPPEGSGTNATDSTKDLVVTPYTTGDVVDISWSAIGEYFSSADTFNDDARRLDVKIERKIGSGSWTQIYQKDYACFGKGTIGNPVQMVVYSDSPNTTEECRYRISFKGHAPDSGNSGMRVGGQRFQIELTG